MEAEGYDTDAAGAICGSLEQQLGSARPKDKRPVNAQLGARSLSTASGKEIAQLVKKKQVHSFVGRAGTPSEGKMYVKTFLLDASTNYNDWGVTPESIPRHVGSFIGKPFILYRNTGREAETYRVPGEFDHPPISDKDIGHALAFQDLFRIGTIIDIQHKHDVESGRDGWWAVSEITDEGAARALREDPLMPMFVSPTIVLSTPNQRDNAIENWTGLHLAGVTRPAFGIKKAYMSGQCEGDRQTCMLALRKASIEHNDGRIGCGFCTYGAMKSLSATSKNDTSHSESGRNVKKIRVNMPEDRYSLYQQASSGDGSNDVKAKSSGGRAGKSRDTDYSAESGTTEPGSMPREEGTNAGDAARAEGLEQKQVEDQQRGEGQPRSEKDKKPLARDQPLPSKPEGTSDEDYEEWKRRIKAERSNIDKIEGRNAAEKLLARIEELSTENASLRGKLSQEREERSTIEGYTKQLNERVVALEAQRKEELDKQRFGQIAGMVNGALHLKDSPHEVRQAQIEAFHKSGMSLETIKSLMEPAEINYRKAAIAGGSNGKTAGYTSRLAIEAREASIKDKKRGSADGEVPYFLEIGMMDLGKEVQ